jgi:UDP-glucuronate 4-epimerase
VDQPVSLYAATKCANELMAHSYAHLFGLPATGLRFFTVYGPWGRPDQAPILFTRAILAGEPIEVFKRRAHGRRDFTYVDDIVEGVVRTLRMPPAGAPPRGDLQHRQQRGRAADRVHRTLSSVIGREASCATRRCSRATCARRTRRSTACAR